MPDRFETFDRFDLPGKTVRPIWITIEVPEETEAGSYTGTIQVGSDKQTTSLNIKVNVQSQVLPKPGDWKFRLDLWQNPWAVAWYYHVEPWSAELPRLYELEVSLLDPTGAVADQARLRVGFRSVEEAVGQARPTGSW
jgi:hypothetical protein